MHEQFLCTSRIKGLNLLIIAISACSKNLLNMSGYFSSPSFPGNYLDDMSCAWHITVPSGHTIHLEFQEFRLKDHPRCKDCFVQIFDGQDLKSPALGRFCGYMYPPLLVSSSNHFTIDLSCLGDVHKARFKAFYHSVSGMWSFVRLACVSIIFARLNRPRKNRQLVTLKTSKTSIIIGNPQIGSRYISQTVPQKEFVPVRKLRALEQLKSFILHCKYLAGNVLGRKFVSKTLLKICFIRQTNS